jgi:hypothetical protein
MDELRVVRETIEARPQVAVIEPRASVDGNEHRMPVMPLCVTSELRRRTDVDVDFGTIDAHAHVNFLTLQSDGPPPAGPSGWNRR